MMLLLTITYTTGAPLGDSCSSTTMIEKSSLVFSKDTLLDQPTGCGWIYCHGY